VRRLLAGAAALPLLGAASPPEPLALHTLAGAPIEVARAPDEAALVLHFWASWCPECAEELPDLEQSARACGAQSHVRVLAVNVGDSAEEASRFAAQHGLTLPLLLDEGGRAWRRSGLYGLPANLIWTAQGVRRGEGSWSAARWRDELGRLGCAGP
jgi:cytochrome c biogenesis protein CcmG/thiol:disulfide interchange protein DsbE